jgi:Tfp pilus assembly protein PilO
MEITNNEKFYSFITGIIKLGRMIEMDDLEFMTNESGITAKIKRMRIG